MHVAGVPPIEPSTSQYGSDGSVHAFSPRMRPDCGRYIPSPILRTQSQQSRLSWSNSATERRRRSIEFISNSTHANRIALENDLERQHRLHVALVEALERHEHVVAARKKEALLLVAGIRRTEPHGTAPLDLEARGRVVHLHGLAARAEAAALIAEAPLLMLAAGGIAADRVTRER